MGRRGQFGHWRNIVLKRLREKLFGESAPRWYSGHELRKYLESENYSEEISEQLSMRYAANLQAAFNKGWSLGQRAERMRK
jgi:hypothetical protein